jgi:hypothetical protein
MIQPLRLRLLMTICEVMNRDTEELPVILAELEESAHAIRGYQLVFQSLL